MISLINNTKTDTLVVTATLGTRKTLERTVDSVSKIGKKRVKHILTCPEDKLIDIKVRFPNLEVVAEPEGKKGIYHALNNIFKKFGKDYKYLTFINDDDYWLPDFKRLFFTLDNTDKFDAVYGRVLFVTENNKKITEQTSCSNYKSFKVLLKKKIVLFTQQATLIKSELFFKVGGFDENYNLIADSKFWVEAIESNAKFRYINVLASAYTLQENQLSSDKITQNKEYTKLFSEKTFNTISWFDVQLKSISFRFSNLSIYLKRYLNICKFN